MTNALQIGLIVLGVASAVIHLIYHVVSDIKQDSGQIAQLKNDINLIIAALKGKSIL